MRFASFLSGGFTAMAVMNPPEKKIEKRTSVHRTIRRPSVFILGTNKVKNRKKGSFENISFKSFDNSMHSVLKMRLILKIFWTKFPQAAIVASDAEFALGLTCCYWCRSSLH